MDLATIVMFALQLVMTGIIGLASWGIKNAISEIKGAITKLEAADKETSEKIDKVQKENNEKIDKMQSQLNDLKADLPLVYVTREDFIRVSNNIDHKLDKLLYRRDAKEG